MRKNKKPNQVRPTALMDIIIPVYNRFDLLDECIKSIPEAAQDVSYRIIVVDNGSDKNSADLFYSKLTNVTVIRNGDNMGFPYACNQGAKRGYSPLLFFLNSDIILGKDSIKTITKDIDIQGVGVVGMKLVFPEMASDLKQDAINRPAGKIQHVGIATNIRGEVFHIFLGWSADHPKVNSINEVYCVTGAALLTRRNIFTKAGGFWKGYGRGTYEDIDYCITVRNMGYNIIVNPTAEGIHYTGATAERYQLGYNLEENKNAFMKRHGDKLTWTEWLHY